MIKTSKANRTAATVFLLLLLGAVPGCGSKEHDTPPGGIKGVITADVCPAAGCGDHWASNPFYNENLQTPTCISDGKCHADLRAGYQCLARDTAVLGGKTLTCDTTGSWH